MMKAFVGVTFFQKKHLQISYLYLVILNRTELELTFTTILTQKKCKKIQKRHAN